MNTELFQLGVVAALLLLGLLAHGIKARKLNR
jgi:hypothetical protein